jgi:hypothetical protein
MSWTVELHYNWETCKNMLYLNYHGTGLQTHTMSKMTISTVYTYKWEKGSWVHLKPVHCITEILFFKIIAEIPNLMMWLPWIWKRPNSSITCLLRRTLHRGGRGGGRWWQHRDAKREVGAEIGATGARHVGEAEVQIHRSTALCGVIGGHPTTGRLPIRALHPLKISCLPRSASPWDAVVCGEHTRDAA